MRRCWPVLLLPISGVACSAFFDPSKLGADATEPADASSNASGDTSASGADDAARTEPDEDSSAPCVAEGGTPMRRIGVYCIDETEVTSGQYATFLDRTDGGSSAPVHPACAVDVDRLPAEGWPSPPEWRSLPVLSVSWCDAWSYCAAHGKRLCGRRGGGALPSTETSNPAASEWYRACSKAGEKRLPYGNEPIVGECATNREVRWVGEKCEGGYRGIFDMVGNAAEWIDVCSTFGSLELCVLQGGDPFESLADCKTVKLLGRHAKNPVAGFRCCAD